MKNPKFFYFLLSLWMIAGVAFAQKKAIVLDDLFRRPAFISKNVTGVTSMNDGANYTKFDQRNTKIVKCSYQTGEQVQLLFDLATSGIKTDYIGGYELSSNEDKLLLQTEEEPIYRWSFVADYWVYDLKTQKAVRLSENGKQQLATFSPDGSKIAFVRKNNIFIKDLTDGSEKQITADGEFNKIINGAPDWVYEEEFGFSKAFEWSSDSKSLSYIRFDESAVKMFSMNMFKGDRPEMTENALYPGVNSFKYPKAGEANSIVSVHSYNLTNGKTVKIDIGTNTDIYVPRIKSMPDPSKLCVYRLNRLQNKWEVLSADMNSGSTTALYTEENKYYIDEKNYDNFNFTPDGKNFYLTSEKDGFMHIYFYDITGKFIKKITSGNFDVTDCYGYDAATKTFYYAAADESPMRRNIFSISLDGKKQTKLSTNSGTNKAEFSKNFKYYINYFTNSQTPRLITLHDGKGKLIRTLEDNAALKKKLEDYNFSYKEFFKFKTTENVELNGWMMKPANFDPQKKYPVLMTQYSGPNSQQVLDNWQVGWEQILAGNGYIIVCVDGRGTGARGEEFRKMTYLQLGKYESTDQIETAKYLGTLPYVDSKRVGIWGWSYGGFMSLLCMTKGADYFKAGVAVAPVTNWRFYDNIYTERFMRTPQENAGGYDDNSPINHIDKYKGKLLICHGSADDNVHVQNTMEFIEKMVQADKQFEMQIYTNRNHGIYGGNTSYHLYTRMLNFIYSNL